MLLLHSSFTVCLSYRRPAPLLRDARLGALPGAPLGALPAGADGDAAADPDADRLLQPGGLRQPQEVGAMWTLQISLEP